MRVERRSNGSRINHCLGDATDAIDERLPTLVQIIGPALLVSTLVVWSAGVVFWRLWSTEWKRRQRAIELRTRVQLHALAMELLKRPESAASGGTAADTLSPQAATGTTPSVELSDSQLRRLLLRKLRQQNAVDIARYRSAAIFTSANEVTFSSALVRLFVLAGLCEKCITDFKKNR